MLELNLVGFYLAQHCGIKRGGITYSLGAILLGLGWPKYLL